MEKSPLNERLASLEAKVEILLDLLKELRDDLKDNPSKEDLDKLENRIKSLEDTDKKIIWKVAGAAGTLSVISAIITAIVVKMF